MPIEPTAEALERFPIGDTGRPLVLTQLLRFTPGGRERYLEYFAKVEPLLGRIGAQLTYAGECLEEPLLAGPGQAWDAVVIVRYPTRAAYADLLRDPDYQSAVALRRAALSEAVMLPMDDWPGR